MLPAPQERHSRRSNYPPDYRTTSFVSRKNRICTQKIRQKAKKTTFYGQTTYTQKYDLITKFRKFYWKYKFSEDFFVIFFASTSVRSGFSRQTFAKTYAFRTDQLTSIEIWINFYILHHFYIFCLQYIIICTFIDIKYI